MGRAMAVMLGGVVMMPRDIANAYVYEQDGMMGSSGMQVGGGGWKWKAMKLLFSTEDSP